MGTQQQNSSDVQTTMVAVDKDKNSNYAVRWAVENLLNNHHNPSLILFHVNHHPAGSSGGHGGHGEADLQELFLTYRGYCARRGVQLKEVVVDDPDISKGILSYIKANYINNIVLGAARNAITRWKFMKQDVPTSVTKHAPDFCSVYVIAKTKAIVTRPALRPAANTAAPPKVESSGEVPAYFMNGGPRVQALSGRRTDSDGLAFAKSPTKDGHRGSAFNMSKESIDLNLHGHMNSTGRDSFSSEAEAVGRLSFGSVDINPQNSDFSFVDNKDPVPAPGTPARDLEAEMRRLKLELKQTMDMYSTACKEAISANRKAKELSDWKAEEARKIEEARLAEEAALAIVQMEKAKCKAAIEAAEAAQKLAEMEAQRRRHAEMKARRESEEKNRALNVLAKTDIRYRKYTIDEIEVATERFSESNKIGEGGYGPVYKGYLDHTPVAIKVLRPDAAQGRQQFQQEVEVLCCIRHPNMVLLLGACPEYGCLVYEYMDNGSLEDRLLRKGSSPTMPWGLRFKIAAEIATALLFLHQTKPEPLVHRDLKPANILIDRNYVSKISDVGLARLVPPSVADSVTQYHMTSAAGTFCYIDPEYQQTGKLTTKSDMYSLGILLLQIITARPPMGLTHLVERSIEKGKFESVLDPTVPDWPHEGALTFAKLALKCAELRKKDRPDLARVVVPELNRLRDLGGNPESHRTNHHHYPESHRTNHHHHHHESHRSNHHHHHPESHRTNHHHHPESHRTNHHHHHAFGNAPRSSHAPRSTRHASPTGSQAPRLTHLESRLEHSPNLT